MTQTLRQAARKRVQESRIARQRAWAEREASLGEAAVEVVAAIGQRDRAEQAAAEAIDSMLKLRVTLTEVGERCGLSLREVTRLKRVFLDTAAAPASSDAVGRREVSGS